MLWRVISNMVGTKLRTISLVTGDKKKSAEVKAILEIRSSLKPIPRFGGDSRFGDRDREA